MDLDDVNRKMRGLVELQRSLDATGVGRPKTEASDQPMPAVNDEDAEKIKAIAPGLAEVLDKLVPLTKEF